PRGRAGDRRVLLLEPVLLQPPAGRARLRIPDDIGRGDRVALIRRGQSLDRVLTETGAFDSGAWNRGRIDSSSNDSANFEFEGMNNDNLRIASEISDRSLSRGAEAIDSAEKGRQ